MKFGVLALDYDGTIAKEGVLDPDVRAAVEEVRTHGIISVLVTGRILTELRSVMGDLRLFDCVVAENGAVVAFPNAGRSTAHGHPPTAAFLEELIHVKRKEHEQSGANLKDAPVIEQAKMPDGDNVRRY